jgi:epoxyqueuosine reductase
VAAGRFQRRDALHVAPWAKRTRPAELIPGTVSCISVRMDYWPQDAADAEATLPTAASAYVSRYALGRDYHKVHARAAAETLRPPSRGGWSFGYRVFTDSAPVLEKALARNAGLGWIGKHTNLIDRSAGSYFFLGEIYLDLELPPTQAQQRALRHVQRLHARLPDRRHRRRPIGSMRGAASPTSPSSWPARFRWNFAAPSAIASTAAMTASWCALGTSSRGPPARRILRSGTAWIMRSWPSCSPGARRFLDKTSGSAIRRIGYERWLRNIAVALGQRAHLARSHRGAARPREQHPSAWCANTCNGRWHSTGAARPAAPAGNKLLPAGLKKCRPRRVLVISANSS